MPSRTELYNPYRNGQYLNVITYAWNRSPRVGGKLQLRQNAVTLNRADTTSVNWPPNGHTPRLASTITRDPPGLAEAWASVDNECLARHTGKLRKGGASLGVTIGSWKQSREMIVSRSNDLRRRLDSTIAVLEGNKGARERLRREREPLANQVLEGTFGWQPLFSDIHSSLTTACGSAVPNRDYITTRVKRVFQGERKDTAATSQSWYVERYTGRYGATYSSKVVISNPNLWLLNRLGLLNPGLVAWDLIPWSFVVGMFWNFSQIISSFTDEIGLEVSDRSYTRSQTFLCEQTYWTNPRYATPTSNVASSATNLLRKKSRTPGAMPKVSLEFRPPELNWGLAVTASALVVQRFSKINRLIRLL